MKHGLGLGLSDVRPSAGGGGGEGPPEWVPEGATLFADFLGLHYWAGDEELALTDLFAASSNGSGTPTIDASGMRPNPAYFKLLALAQMPVGDFTIVLTWSIDSFPAEGYLPMMVGSNGDTGFEIIIGAIGQVSCTDYSGAYAEQEGSVLGQNKLAVSFSDGEIWFSLNGAVAIVDDTAADPFSAWGDGSIGSNDMVAAGFAVEAIEVRPLVAAAGLPALSAI